MANWDRTEVTIDGHQHVLVSDGLDRIDVVESLKQSGYEPMGLKGNQVIGWADEQLTKKGRAFECSKSKGLCSRRCGPVVVTRGVYEEVARDHHRVQQNKATYHETGPETRSWWEEKYVWVRDTIVGLLSRTTVVEMGLQESREAITALRKANDDFRKELSWRDDRDKIQAQTLDQHGQQIAETVGDMVDIQADHDETKKQNAELRRKNAELEAQMKAMQVEYNTALAAHELRLKKLESRGGDGGWFGRRP